MDILTIPCIVLLAVGAFAAVVLWGVNQKRRADVAEGKLKAKIGDLEVRRKGER